MKWPNAQRKESIATINMSDAASTPTSSASCHAALVKQLDFYFSDSNYPRDKFLRTRAESDKEGMIGIEAFKNFKRLNEILGQPDLSMEQFVDAIISAIKSSSPQNFTLDEEKKAVKRSQAIPLSDVTAPRTMWVEEVPENTVWQQLFDFFKPHGDVISVRVQKKKDSDAKPCAFVEFDSPETVEKVCKLELTFEGTTLKLQPKKVFLAGLKGKKTDNKTKKDSEPEETGASTSVKDEVSFMAKGAGSVLKLLALGPSCSRETIKEVFGEYGQIAFVDFERGWSDGWLRFDDASDAAAAAAGFCAKPVDVGGAIPTVSLLVGEEETAYLKKAELERGNKFNRGGRGGRGGHSRGGRGGRGGKGGRDSRDARDSRDSREGGSKKRKVDSED